MPATEFDLLSSPIEPGLTIIEASAGTGKTYSISHLVPRLLIDGTLSKLSEFLLVTFTNDAAQELAERARKVLTRLSHPPDDDERKAPDGHLAQLRQRLDRTAGASARLAAAIRDLDQLAVSTIHSFCQRTLQQEGALCGMPVMPELTTDDADQLDVALREAWLGELDSRPALAAVAVGGGWQLKDATAFIKAFRSGKSGSEAKSEPPAQPLNLLLEGIYSNASGLKREGEAWRKLLDVLSGPDVVLNADAGGSVDSICAQLGCILSGNLNSPAYWKQLKTAAQLPGLINGTKSKSGKKAVAESAWLRYATEISAQVQGLEWSWHHHLAEQVLPRVADRIKQQRLITQDALITTLHEAVTGGGERSHALVRRLAGRFKVGLIDESQDTDSRQMAIFRSIFLGDRKDGRLLLIGDPKQAIYRFRGADLSTYLEARKLATCRYSLTQTFRAPERLVQAQNAFFCRDGAFHHPDMPFTAATSALKDERSLWVGDSPVAPIEVWLPDSDRKDLSAADRRVRAFGGSIADTIIGLMQHPRAQIGSAGEKRPVKLDDFAVLVRTNKQAAQMADLLEEQGLPVILNSGASVFASEEAAELRDLLHAVWDPSRTVHLRWALATRLIGLDAGDLRAFDEEPAWEDCWRQTFTTWRGLWQRQGLAELWSALDTPGVALKLGISQRLAQLSPGGERRATNYRHLTDLLLEAARERYPRPADLLRWLGQRIATADETDVPDEHQIQLASEANAVRVLTMHKSKGLEYPLVFCPTLVEPLRKPEGAQSVTPGGGRMLADLSRPHLVPEACRAVAHADLEENLRLTYVALTRAQVRIWITSYSPYPTGYGVGPLDWLLRPAAELATHRVFDVGWTDLAKKDRAARHREVLETLQNAGIETRTIPPRSNLRWSILEPLAEKTAANPLRALRPPAVPAAWAVSSFSFLTRGVEGIHPASDTSDLATGAEPADELDVTPLPATPADAQNTPCLTFMRAPRGASVGTPLHAWIESWDFQPLPPTDAGESPLKLHVARAGLPPTKAGQPDWVVCLDELFKVLREVRLPLRDSLSPPLHEITPDPTLSEWKFDLPLREEQKFPRSLVKCFQHAGTEGAAYAKLLADLPATAVSGMLTGVIDRLVCIDGEWGLIDWKSNWLGDDLAAYREPELRACAYSAHYWLQLHLYLVALRRWRRAAGEKNPRLAGAWLVFLRGIAANTSRGVLTVRPTESLLDDLETLFAPLPSPGPDRSTATVRP